MQPAPRHPALPQPSGPDAGQTPVQTPKHPEVLQPKDLDTEPPVPIPKRPEVQQVKDRGPTSR
ncbi:hypothetical protein JYU34_007907 [Plutella xylostella]|uniref:Uncharacterized protein n=1 Tax=Plutella xylostella TaxID=51655 RepID=A0ABQ7QNC8_PLUXY|nr:hypothetical protein JYU34_007907 [Plutella xylostella]